MILYTVSRRLSLAHIVRFSHSLEIGKQTDRPIGMWTSSQTDRPPDRHTNSQTDGQIDH